MGPSSSPMCPRLDTITESDSVTYCYPNRPCRSLGQIPKKICTLEASGGGEQTRPGLCAPQSLVSSSNMPSESSSRNQGK